MTSVFLLMWLGDIVGSVSMIGVACVAFFGMAFLGATMVAAADNSAEPFGRVWRYTRWLLVPIVIASITPNTSTIRLLAAASAADALAQTQIGAKGLEAANAVLDKIIKEASK